MTCLIDILSQALDSRIFAVDCCPISRFTYCQLYSLLLLICGHWMDFDEKELQDSDISLSYYL